ncbi:MAG: LPP20 family lipoprotein, partial [Flavobacteriales bacterium]|nr:LPP20 family lipoprotein [Flavobacteriales bacterium]
MRILLYISTCVLLISCSRNKEITSSIEENLDPVPSWVSSRPITSFHYIGIGKASKRGTPDEYQTIARRNALNDMASEIEVTVNSNSLLYTLERNDMLTESFSESIITRSNLRLEGFEVSDDYSDEDYYWVYYRLEKSLYESIKAQRKQEAIERAEIRLNSARQMRESGDLSTAASNYVDALRELQPYWGESNPGSGGESVDRTALNELVEMRSMYTIQVQDESINLDESNGFRQLIELKSTLNGISTKAVPFEYRFDKLKKKKVIAEKISLTISAGEKEQSLLSVTADPFKELRKEVKREGYGFLEGILEPEIVLVDIYTSYPLVSIYAEQENNKGEIAVSEIMRSAIIQQLASYGIGVDESGSSRYKISCRVKSREGGLAQNFQIVYTDITLE